MVGGIEGSKSRRTVGRLGKRVVKGNMANEIGILMRRSGLVLRQVERRWKGSVLILQRRLVGGLFSFLSFGPARLPLLGLFLYG